MRLAYCVRALFPQHGYGGLERSASGLMHHLLARGTDIALFTRAFPQGEPLHTNDLPGRLTVHTARYGRLPLPPNGIPARLTNYRYFVEDVGRRVRVLAMRGHVQGIYAHGLCAWGIRQAGAWGVPFVANPHGMEEFKIRDPLKRLAYAPFRRWARAGARAADRVVATDHSMRAEVERLLGVAPDRVVVIPNGIDPVEVRALVDPAVQAELRQCWPRLLPGTDNPARLAGISVGRLEANKGFENLLRALASCRDQLSPGWSWFIVGEGSQRAHLESLAGTLGILDRVQFTGTLTDSDLHSLYALCNLFAHPTLYEGSSLVTLEAMAHGLPVVASAVGGIPDKVVDGETGFLVAPGDTGALAAGILWIDAHPLTRGAMGEKGALMVDRLFSWQKLAGLTESLFLELREEKGACQDGEVSEPSC